MRWGVRDTVTGGTVRAYDLATAQHCVNRDPVRCELMMDIGYGWVAVADTFMMQRYGLAPLPPPAPRRLACVERVAAWLAVDGAGVHGSTLLGVRRLCVGMGRVIGGVLARYRQPFRRSD